MKGLKRTLICLLLAGCGTEDAAKQSKIDNSSATTDIVAKNVFQVVEPDTEQRIDIQNINQNTKLRLTALQAVSSLNDSNCELTEFDDKNIYFSLTAGDYCSYQYTVQDGLQSSTANLEVYSSKATAPILSPIVKKHDLNRKMPAQFYIGTALSKGIPEDYFVVQDSIRVLTENKDDAGEVSLNGTLIEYTPSATGLPEWKRIHYKLKSQNPALLNSPLMGVIYISTFDEAAPAPQISPSYYTHSSPYNIGDGDLLLNLAELTGLTIKDDNDWQLVYISTGSQNTSVRLANPDSIHNQSIAFNTTKVGEHNLTYIVTNHVGASAIGHIKIYAQPKEQSKNWNDIRLEFIERNDIGGIYSYREEKYHSTPRFIDVPDIFSSVESIEDNGHIIAGFTHTDQATAYCQSYGRVATLSELKNMRAIANGERGDGQLINGETSFTHWPKAYPYLALDDDDSEKFFTYNFADKSEKVFDQQEPFYLSCMDDGSIKIQSLIPQFTVGEEIHLLALLTHKKDTVVKNLMVQHTGSGETNARIERISSTEIQVWGGSTKSGEIRISAKAESSVPGGVHMEKTVSADNIDIAPDYTSHRANGVLQSNSQLVADYARGPDDSVIRISVTDKYTNPVAGQKAFLKFYSSNGDELIDEDSFLIEPVIFEEDSDPGVSDRDGVSHYTIQTQIDPNSMQNLKLPSKATFVASTNEDFTDSFSFDLDLISMVCSTSDMTVDETTGRCLKVNNFEGSDPLKRFTGPPSREFFNFAAKFFSNNIQLSQPAEYVSAVRQRLDTGLIRNHSAMFNNQITPPHQYNDFDATPFVVFRGHRAAEGAEMLSAPRAWCSAVSKLGVLGKEDWRLLADPLPTDGASASTSQQISHALYHFLSSSESNNASVNSQKLFFDYKWFIRAANYRAWVYPEGLVLTGNQIEHSLDYLNLGNGDYGTTVASDREYGHAICQTQL